jgi:Clp amino terminal domain, pathogenicity island component
VSAAVGISDHLGELADHLIGHFVDQARKAGASWTDIGRSMGVTKQAAQKRFVAKDTDWQTLLQEAFKAHPFARFTDRARRAVLAAQHEAREHRHDHIGTEHLALGMLAEPPGAVLVGRLVAEQGAGHPASLVKRQRARLNPRRGRPPGGGGRRDR